MNRRLMLARAADALSAWNRGDADGVVANMADDVLWRDVALGMPLHGREAVRSAAQCYIAAFPDLRVEETSSTLHGARLVQEVTVTGTHRGELLGVQPTGRWTETYAAIVTTYDEDARVIEGSVYWNLQAMLHQLGVAPALEPATA
jgi:steroid delta-isomerase-like uncharacterized protein